MATMPVVACVDGSEESLRATEWAAQEARLHGVPLRIVSAVAMPPLMHACDIDPRTGADELCGESARALGEAAARSAEVSSRLVIDARLLIGLPARVVADSGSGALMLVVGARGAGGFGAMLLGSVSRYTAMHASCPVIVVKEGTCTAQPEVVVGLHDLHDATAVLAFAFEEACLRGATLVAVHSWDGPTAATWHPADPTQFAAEADSSLAESLGPWRDKYPDVPVRRDVVQGHPARVLTCYSSRADLVVISRHGRGAGSAVGGIQHALLSHARGPVAVVPSPGRTSSG
jgi:nucleotide-binding universal stress UspA family protein